MVNPDEFLDSILIAWAKTDGYTISKEMDEALENAKLNKENK